MKVGRQAMRISPKYCDKDWRILELVKEEDWRKAVDIFEDRMRGRFLNFVASIEKNTFAGFVVMAIDCLLIETLQQFFEGLEDTPNRQGKIWGQPSKLETILLRKSIAMMKRRTTEMNRQERRPYLDFEQNYRDDATICICVF